jgi:hypothetical protein
MTGRPLKAARVLDATPHGQHVRSSVVSHIANRARCIPWSVLPRNRLFPSARPRLGQRATRDLALLMLASRHQLFSASP